MHAATWPCAYSRNTGKYSRGVEFPEGDYRRGIAREKLDKMADEAAQIQKNEVPPGVSMAAWALAWCLKNDAVTSVIPGARNVKQLKANAAAADITSS